MIEFRDSKKSCQTRKPKILFFKYKHLGTKINIQRPFIFELSWVSESKEMIRKTEKKNENL